jgi:hypothetical protein
MKIMIRFICLALSFCSSVAIADSEGTKLLFGHMNESLPDADKAEIFVALGYSVSPDGKRLTSKDCGEVGFETHVTDLNGDGTPEVFVISGNTCTSGSTGASIVFFVKGADRKYQKQLGFPAISYEIMNDQNNGFPDLMFGGPGFCLAVWRWNGEKYEFKCGQESLPGACSRKNVKTLCKSR